MHELSVCQELLKQVTHIAAEHHATAVEKIHLQVGPLSGVEPALLQAAFKIARINTLADTAEILIQPTSITVRCKICHAESKTTLNNLTCVNCGSWQTELLSGDELLLKRVEMQTVQ